MMANAIVINSKQRNLTNPTQSFYFLGLIFYLLLYLQYETLWDYDSMISYILKWLALCCLTLPFLQSFFQYKKALEIVMIITSLLITCVVGINSGYSKDNSLLYVLTITFLLVFGAKNIEFRKILKVYLIVGGGYCIITVFSSLMGIIPNLVDEIRRDEDAIGVVDTINRMCLGYGWSTNMANHVLFVLLTYFYWINRLLKKKETLLIIFLIFSVMYFTGSRLSTFCVLLLILLTIMLKTDRGRAWLTSKVAFTVFMWSIPFFVFISYYATKAYDETNPVWLGANIIMTGRLRIGQEALETAGIPLWGQFYEMFGSARSDGSIYNYLDNSFIQSLVIYGLIYTLMLVIAYMCICRVAYHRKDFLLMYSIFVAGVSGLIAQHFIEMYMNPFLIALFAKHTVIEGADGNA